MSDYDARTLTAAGDWMIVQKGRFVSPSGIVMRADPNPNMPKVCTVLSVGPGRPSESGDWITPTGYEVGDTLLCGNAGLKLAEYDDGTTIWALKPSEVLAVVP